MPAAVITIAVIALAVSGCAVAWALVRRHRERTGWSPLGRHLAARVSLLGAMPCADCLGDLGQCRAWCVRAGGRGDNIGREVDHRHVEEQDRQVARRTRRRVVSRMPTGPMAAWDRYVEESGVRREVP